jgi:hypothetical protein
MDAYMRLATVFEPARWQDEGPDVFASATWWRALVDSACRALGQTPLPCEVVVE